LAHKKKNRTAMRTKDCLKTPFKRQCGDFGNNVHAMFPAESGIRAWGCGYGTEIVVTKFFSSHFPPHRPLGEPVLYYGVHPKFGAINCFVPGDTL